MVLNFFSRCIYLNMYWNVQLSYLNWFLKKYRFSKFWEIRRRCVLSILPEQYAATADNVISRKDIYFSRNRCNNAKNLSGLKLERNCKRHRQVIIWKKKNSVKGGVEGLRKFWINESPLKMMKNAFYFTLKALFVLKIFKFLSWLFGHVEKTARLER